MNTIDKCRRDVIEWFVAGCDVSRSTVSPAGLSDVFYAMNRFDQRRATALLWHRNPVHPTTAEAYREHLEGIDREEFRPPTTEETMP